MTFPTTLPPRSRRDRLETELAQIGRDRSAGAATLARETLRALSRGLRSFNRAKRPLPASWASRVAGRLGQMQPAMAAFARYAIDWERLALPNDGQQRRRSANTWLTVRRRQLRGELACVAALARRRLPPGARVVTLSRSESVRRALTTLRGRQRPRSVLVLESRPGAEGREMARDLRENGLAARWVLDRRGTEEAGRADVILLGADAIYPDGTVVHKVGTRKLARAAHRAGVPVFVLAGESKMAPLGRVPGALPARFDRTPARWITEYWTSRGAISSAAWRGRSPHRQPHEPPLSEGTQGL